MKIILSHDIDHLHWNEHYLKDLFLFGSLFRNTKGLLKRQISIQLYIKRLKCYGRMHRIPELVDFYQDRKINANFFFGMSNALGLSYNYLKTKKLIEKLKLKHHSVGVHGISYDNQDEIKNEREKFRTVSNSNIFGIRTHYLRLNDNSLKLFDDVGYLFDSSIDSIKNPFMVNQMWEIPISIMDVSLVKNAYLNQDLEEWKRCTFLRLEEALTGEIPYFVINFHDVYFSENFPTIKSWYIWLVDMLKSESYSFISFEDAVNELNTNK